MFLIYWENKDWLTKKGTEPKTLESAINVYNGIATQREVRKRIKKEKIKGKKEKREKKKELYKSLKRVKKRSSSLQTQYIPYNEQLLDEKWNAFRKFIFVVRGGKCETCGKTTSLQVHHLHYRRGAMAWEYDCNEVMVLCKDCHKKIHGIE